MRDKLLAGLFAQLGKHKGALPASWSRMELLKRCPRQWDLRYRKGLREPAMPAADITDLTNMRAGKAIHWILEKSVQSVTRLSKDVTHCYDFFFDHARTVEEDGKVRERLDLLRAPALEVLRRVMSFADKSTTFHTEKKLRINRSGKAVRDCSWAGLGWNGVVDLEIERRHSLLILDYKSEEYSEDRERSTSLQTGMYAYAEMMRKPELLEVTTGCAYLMSNDIRLEVPFTRDEFQKLRQRILGLYSEYLALLESGTTEPRPSSYCKYCRFAKDCPALGDVDGTQNEENEAGKNTQTWRYKAAVAKGDSTGMADAPAAYRS